jgi:hypothetical protein
MDSAEKKAEAGNKTSLGDLERVVKVRKTITAEPNT